MSEKDTQIGSLSLKVKSDTDSAVKGLDKLKETLNKLKSVSTGKNMSLNGLKELSSSLARLKNASSGIKLNSIASGISKIKESLSGVGKSVNGITRLTAAIEKLGVVSKSLVPVAGSVEDIKSAVKTSGNATNRKIESLVSKEPVKKPVINIAGAGGAGKMIDEDEIKAKTNSVVTSASKVSSTLDNIFFKGSENFLKNASNLDLLKLKLEGYKNTLNKVFEDKKPGSENQIVSLIDKIRELSREIDNLQNKGSNIFTKIASDFSDIPKPIRSFFANALKMPFNFIGRGFETLRDKISGAIQRIKSFGSSLARIAMYRAIRSILSEISKGFQEGISNAYEFSKISGSTLSGSLDRIATSMLYLKNSIGAMAAPLINAVAPAIDFLVQKFAGLVNFIGQAIASLTGQKTWLKAKVYATEYSSSAEKAARASKRAGDNAAKSAKKVADAVKNATLSIDELHIIEKERAKDSEKAKNIAGGSGSVGPDFSKMFEEVPIESKVSDMMTKLKSYFEKGDWEGLGKELGDKVNSAFDSAKFKDFGNKIGEVIQASVKTANSFLDTVDFENVGKSLAELFNGAMEKVNFVDVGKLCTKPFTGLADIIIGAIEKVNWKDVAKSLSDFVIGIFDGFNGWIEKRDWDSFTTTLSNKIYDFISNVKWGELAIKCMRFFKNFVKVLWSLGFDLPRKFMEKVIDEFLEKQFGLTPEKAAPIGMEIATGIMSGITSSFFPGSSVLMPLAPALGNLLGEVKKFFGIQSPSTLMRDEVGVNIAQGLVDGFSSKLKSLSDTFTNAAKDIINWFTGGDGKGNIFDKFKGFGESITSKFGSAVSDTYTNVKDTLITWSSSVGDWFTNVGNAAGDIFKQFADIGSGIVESFKNGVDTAFEGMGNFFKGIGSSVAGWFKPVTDAFKDSGKDSVNGYAQGFSIKSEELKRNLERYGPSYLKSFNKGIQVRSPSKLFMESGEYTVEGYNIGIENKMGSTIEVIKKWLNSFKNITPDLVFDLNGASLSYGMDDYLGQVDAQINGRTEISASGFREGIETFYKDEIIPLINQIATDMRYQANKDEKTVVQIGGRTIEESVSRQRFANGYNFLA